MVSFRDVVFSLSTASDVSEVLPLISWIFLAKKKMPYNILGWFFLFSSSIKLYTLVTAELRINNMPAFHILACMEIVMLYCFYCHLLYKHIVYWPVFLLIVINVVNTLFHQNIFSFNSLAWTIDMLVLIGLGMFYFFRLYKNDSSFLALEKRPDFVITTGWLLYAAGSLFTYLLGTEILSGRAEGFFKNAWFFQVLSNLTKNIIISYGFWMTRKNE